jgi:NAD(P)-dependent dehydrogenase (short-subunit alcohol dehydrogenase family)
MEEKVVLITGANRGIGFEIAKQLGSKGFRILLSGRNPESIAGAAEQLRGFGIFTETLEMDVSDPDSIAEAAESCLERNLTPNVLINNAGILLKEDVRIHQDHEFVQMRTWNTNVFGPLRIIKAFLPLMSRPGRIINISSGGGSMSDPVGGWAPAYCASKSMLNALTRQLSHELSLEKISVNAVCPGWVRTRMGGPGAPRSVEKGAETPVWLASEAPANLTGKFFRDKREILW